MGINYDPRRIVSNSVQNLTFVPIPYPITITKDNDAADASVGMVWEDGPETLKHLFFTVGYDVVITIGNPKSHSERPVQDRPVHYQMRYPVTVTTVDKYSAGVVVCTAPRMQYKVTYALRYAIEADAQSAGGASPARTIRISTEIATHKRVGGIDIWEANHFVEYETGYGWEL